jgi:hypothetical protein
MSKVDIEPYAFLLSENKTVELGPYRDPAWSNDGKRIVAVTFSKLNNEIVILDETGALVSRIPIIGYAGRPRFSPDGLKVYYQLVTKNDRTLLAVCDIALGTHSILVDPDAGLDVISYDVSPDGHSLLYVLGGHYGRNYQGTGIFVSDSTGASATRVAKNGLEAFWLPGGEIAYLTRFGENDEEIGGRFGSIFKMNLATKLIQKLEDAPVIFFNSPLKLSRDGKYFYTALPCGRFGQHLVRWPVGSPNAAEDITHCAGRKEIPTTHTSPDWCQGE